MHYEYYKKSREFLEKKWEKYAHFFEEMADESREVRYHLLDFLYAEFGYVWPLLKDKLGRPIPITTEAWRMLHWSLSHSENYTAFIVSDSTTGIDIAEIRERDNSLLELHALWEYVLLWWKNWKNFYFLWTAKESIIKSNSCTIDDIKNISLQSILSEWMYKFVFQGQEYTIKSLQEDWVIISMVIHLDRVSFPHISS